MGSRSRDVVFVAWAGVNIPSSSVDGTALAACDIELESVPSAATMRAVVLVGWGEE